MTDREQEADSIKIEMEGIFEDYQEEDIEAFVKDLYLTFNVEEKLDKEYGDFEDPNISKELDRFRKMISDWNEKYRDILLDFRTDGMQCRLNLLLKEQDLKQIAAIVKRMNGFSKMKKLNKNELVAIFGDANSEDSLTINREDGKTKLVYLKEDMALPGSAEFRMCAYYALLDGFNKEIDLQRYANEFSFNVMTDESVEEESGWFSRYPNIHFGR